MVKKLSITLYIILFLLLLFSCKKKSFTYVEMAFPKDSLTCTTIRIDSASFQEWVYKSESDYESPHFEYFKYQAPAYLIDSLRLLLNNQSGIIKGYYYGLKNSKEQISFVFKMGASINRRHETLIMDTKSRDVLMKIYGLVNRRNYILKKFENRKSGEIIIDRPSPETFLMDSKKK